MDMQVKCAGAYYGTKEKQLQKLKVSIKEKIGMEVINIAQPIVHSVSKQIFMSLAKAVYLLW